MQVLLRIKRLVLRGAVRFTEKARLELDADGLDPEDAIEAIVSAPVLRKAIRSRSQARQLPRETLYVIIGVSFGGVAIYTKGVLRKEGGADVFYILISSKRDLP